MNLDEILRNSNDFGEGLSLLLESELEPLLFSSEGSFNTVYEVFKQADENRGLLKTINKNSTDFISVLNTKKISDLLRKIVETVFYRKNKETGLKDTPKNAFYSIYIPLSLYCQLLPPQVEGNKIFYNTNGTVSIAEFFDSINAIYWGYNADDIRKCSLDNVSIVSDYFNEGYNLFVDSYSSYAFNLYNRLELLRPIKRIELAYLLVFCYSKFKYGFNEIYTSHYSLGISFDWLSDLEKNISNYIDKDGYSFCVKTNEEKIILDIREYKGSHTFTEFIDLMEQGKQKIPLPLVASFIELLNHDIFYNSGTELALFKEVSRGELIYTLFKICNLDFERKEV